MSANWRSRLKAYRVPALVVVAVCAVVGSAARSPVDWRTIDRTAAGHPAVQASVSQPAAPPAEIGQTVVALNRLFEPEERGHEAASARLADDLQILRRLSLSLCGTIPSLEEIRQFESDPSPDRLDRWTVRLLEDNRYADYFAERLARSFVGAEMGQPILFRRDRFVDWLRQNLSKNVPYDEVVRKIISETGLWTDHPATNYITAALANDEIDRNKLAGRTVRAFLGQRIDCAQCHDHPFAEWKQAQFQGLAAQFGQTRNSIVGIEDKTHLKFEVEDRKTLKRHVVEAAVPFHPEWLPATGTPRARLAAWITHPENRRFERATANRIWGLLFGKPYHAPVDDLPDPPDAQKPDVLDVVGADFREHRYDLRRMIRVITASRPFRIDSVGPESGTDAAAVGSAKAHAATDTAAESSDGKHPSWTGSDSPDTWAQFPMTRLRPEQLIGSILQATSLRTIDQNSHLFVRIERYFKENEFVKQYGDLGENELDERAGTVAQALLRMNGNLAADAITGGPFSSTSRIGTFAGSDETCLETCYLVALTRRPTKAEADYFLNQLACAGKSTEKDARAQVVEDIFWGLFNSPEFSWQH